MTHNNSLKLIEAQPVEDDEELKLSCAEKGCACGCGCLALIGAGALSLAAIFTVSSWLKGDGPGNAPRDPIDIVSRELGGPIAIGKNKDKNHNHIIYDAPDDGTYSPDIKFPENIPDGTSKTFDVQISNIEEVRIKTYPKTPEEVMEKAYEEPGPTLVILGDCDHRSLGILREKVKCAKGGKPSHLFLEWGEDDQAFYDAFAEDHKKGRTQSPAITAFKNAVSMVPGWAHAPDKSEKILRPLFMHTHHQLYQIATDSETSLIDVGSGNPLNIKAEYARNLELSFKHAYVVFRRMLLTSDLPIQESIDPIRTHIDNICNIAGAEETRKLTEEERLTIFNIARSILEDGFMEFHTWPKNWQQAENPGQSRPLSTTFSTPIDLAEVGRTVAKLQNDYAQARRDAEDERDDPRNEQMVNRIVETYESCDDKENFKGMLIVGQGHLDDELDMDEMLKEAMPGVRIIRIDLLSCKPERLKELGSQYAKGKFEGSDGIIFTPGPITYYPLEISPAPE